ncbi:MAG: hypothetical protein ACKO8Q_03690 [Bacteroidota bacterium]
MQWYLCADRRAAVEFANRSYNVFYDSSFRDLNALWSGFQIQKSELLANGHNKNAVLPLPRTSRAYKNSEENKD